MTMPITLKSNWWEYIVKRVFIAVIAFFVISFTFFMLIQDAETSYIMDRFRGDPIQPLPPDEVESIKREFGLDTAYSVQYIQWLGDFFTGYWGFSLYAY
jgi:ABC-type dipeptide/oligopeptide/nickel transport system permease component